MLAVGGIRLETLDVCVWGGGGDGGGGVLKGIYSKIHFGSNPQLKIKTKFKKS